MMVFAYALGGRTVLADSYQLAYLIPSTIYEFIVGGLLSAIFIPLLVREQEEHGKNSPETWHVANLLMGAVGTILFCAGLIGMIAAPWIIGALTAMDSGVVAEDKQRIATMMFRYFTPQIFLLGINAVCMAILNSLSVFAVTASTPIINNIIVITTFLLYHFGMIDITGLAIGTTIGTASMILVQVPWLIRAGMKFRPKLNLRHPVFKSITSMGWPIAIESIANLGGWAVRSNLLSTVLGAFAIYTLSFQIIMMPYGIFAVSIATVLYPTLSRHAANNRMSEFVSDMALGFRWTVFILLPISLGASALSLPIVRVLFEHKGGQFTYADSLFAASYLKWYALSIAPYAMVMFGTRVFFSRKDTATPAGINIIGVIFNAIVSYLLLKAMGAPGIALSAALTYSLTTSLSLFMIKRVTGGLGGKMFWLPIAKMLGAALLMAIVVNTVEVWSRPHVVLMEHGKRLAMRVPESAARGGLTLIRNDQDLARVWTAMEETTASLPQVDFSRKTLALVWGPQSHTTSTIQVTGKRKSDGQFQLAASVAADSKTSAGTAVVAAGRPLPNNRPAYALVELDRPAASADLSITVTQPGMNGVKGRFGGSEFLRLIWLVGLGAAIYTISVYLFGVPEVEKTVAALQTKLKRLLGK